MSNRDFHQVPKEGLGAKVKCHLCHRVLEPGDWYYMTEDSSWLFCEVCGSGPVRPEGPRQVLPAEHEREPLHKKRTLREQIQ